MKTKKINCKNLPVYWPVNITLVLIMMMKVYDVPDFCCGIIWTMIVVLWLASGYVIFASESVDIFKEEK